MSETRQKLSAFRDAIDTGDFIVREGAERALDTGEAAFWCSASYSNQPGSLFGSATARLASIEAARDELRDYFEHNRRDVNDTEWLDTLVPLNALAVDQLMAAYESAGTFKDRSELMKRATRHGWVFDDEPREIVTVRSVSGNGPLKTGVVTGTGIENGQPIIDYRTPDGRENWAYDWQVVERHAVDERAREAVEGNAFAAAAE